MNEATYQASSKPPSPPITKVSSSTPSSSSSSSLPLTPEKKKTKRPRKNRLQTNLDGYVESDSDPGDHSGSESGDSAYDGDEEDGDDDDDDDDNDTLQGSQTIDSTNRLLARCRSYSDLVTSGLAASSGSPHEPSPPPSLSSSSSSSTPQRGMPILLPSHGNQLSFDPPFLLAPRSFPVDMSSEKKTNHEIVFTTTSTIVSTTPHPPPPHSDTLASIAPTTNLHSASVSI